VTIAGAALHREARELFRHVAGATAGRSLCHPVARAAAAWAAKFGEPMRVAVAGEIKHGKSTLVNALVAANAALPASDQAQDRAVATGQLETTYVLTELAYGQSPVIRVKYRDQTEALAPLDQLHALTARHRDATTGEGDTEMLAAIDRVIVTLDAPMLKQFRLIDTPGFNSVKGTDAAASLALLTTRELEGADAVLFTINNEGISSLSRDVVRQFTAMTPLKAIGVMPRANQLWPTARAKAGPGDADPDLELLNWAQQVIDAMRPGHGRELFHTVLPVAGILGEAAALAPDEELAALQEFVRLEPADLAVALTAGASSRRHFASRPDFPLSPETRQRLVQRFSPWGLYMAVHEARADVPAAELRCRLDERSGVAALRQLIGNHFGERAGTVRVREALGEVTRLNRRLRLRIPEGGGDHATLLRVGRDLEAFQLAHEVTFSQVDVLGGLYRGELNLSPDLQTDLLRLTGERGSALAARLGLPTHASRSELLAAAVAASQRWATAPRTGKNQPVVQMMIRICDAIQHQIRTGPPDETEYAR